MKPKQNNNDIINYYNLLDKGTKNETKIDKNFKQHYILPCSLIMQIGKTGTGKSLTLINFL